VLAPEQLDRSAITRNLAPRAPRAWWFQAGLWRAHRHHLPHDALQHIHRRCGIAPTAAIRAARCGMWRPSGMAVIDVAIARSRISLRASITTRESDRVRGGRADIWGVRDA